MSTKLARTHTRTHACTHLYIFYRKRIGLIVAHKRNSIITSKMAIEEEERKNDQQQQQHPPNREKKRIEIAFWTLMWHIFCD